MIDLSIEPLNLDTFLTKIVNQISFEDCEKIKYSSLGNHSKDEDLANVIKQESYDLITKSIEKEDGYSYVYIIRNSEGVKYVGRAIDIRLRLKNHLIKKNKGTASKIKKVFDELDSTKDTELDLCILKIKGNKVYLLIEALLIEHYETMDKGWNAKGS